MLMKGTAINQSATRQLSRDPEGRATVALASPLPNGMNGSSTPALRIDNGAGPTSHRARADRMVKRLPLVACVSEQFFIGCCLFSGRELASDMIGERRLRGNAARPAQAADNAVKMTPGNVLMAAS